MILHKTEVKGVKTGLASEDEVVNAFNDMYDRLRKDFEIRGILLEKMVPSGVELIVGLQKQSSIWSSNNVWTRWRVYRTI